MPVTRLTLPLLVLLIGAAGCADGGVEPDPEAGALRVSTSTTGGPADPDGYALSIDEGAPVPIGSGETITIGDVLPGNHTLALSGVAQQCALEGPNPLSVTVAENDTLEVELSVACGEGGPLEITTRTLGGEPDADGYLISVDAGSGQPIPANGMMSIPDLPPGEHQVGLSGAAANCAVVGANPRSVRVAVGEATQTSFVVSCPGPGTLRVLATTTGQQLDPDGFLIAVDDEAEVRLPLGQVLRLEGVPAGDHTVRIGGLADNCMVAGSDRTTVAVRGDDTVTVEFAVTCAGESGPIADELLFTSDRLGSDHLFRMRIDGSDLVDLTPASTARNGKWSPDGATILFSSPQGGNAELFIMEADGSGSRRLTHTPENEVLAVWSPDGARIAATVDGEIRLMDTTGSVLATLGPGVWPSWSPDGTRIAFARSNSALRNPFTGQYAADIYVVAIDGKNAVNLTRTTTAFTSYSAPSWSPDGTRIACWMQRPVGAFPNIDYGLVVMRANGSEQRTLVGDDVLSTMPIWSPGGRAIAFAHQTSQGSSIQIVDVTDGRISSVTAGAARDVPTSWR
jgi:Tol biopolymer transport system component